MKRLAMAAIMALGCGTATNTTPIGADAATDAPASVDAGAADAGRTLAEWQFEAANTLRSEMVNAIREMRTTPGASAPTFIAANAEWDDAGREAMAAANTDAGLAERRSAVVRVTLDPMFPAYCAVRAALPGFTPTVAPRIPCPAPAPAMWWELYP